MKHKLSLLSCAIAITSIGHLSAATAVVNFGAALSSPDTAVNQYATPPADYAAGTGNFTTSLTGTTGATGTNYNTVQTFKDTAGNNLGITLNINRSAGRVFEQAPIVYNNTTAVNEIASTISVSSSSINAAATSYIYPGAGGSDLELLTLNGLHDGSNSLGYNVTIFFGISAQAGSLTLATITGGTTTSLTYAGQDGNGFDSSTLAASGPGTNEITLVKWVGTLSSSETSLALDLDANNKAGLAFLAYQITPVPEASTALLCGLGALGLIRRRRA